MERPATDLLATWNRDSAARDPAATLAWGAATFPGRVAFASSLGLEDQVISNPNRVKAISFGFFRSFDT